MDGIPRPSCDDKGSWEPFSLFNVSCREKFTSAYLLTHDHALAEDLVQTALAKAWFAWSRIEGADPEPYVRRVMINTYSSWWRRKWNGEQATGELPETSTDPSPVEERHAVWQALIQDRNPR